MRRYGANLYRRWKGITERSDRCVVEINVNEPDDEIWAQYLAEIDKASYQCSHNRGHGPDGLYCAQHARMIEAGKPVCVPEDKP